MLCIAQKLRRLEKRFKTSQNRDYEKAVILYLAVQSFSAVSCVSKPTNLNNEDTRVKNRFN